MRGVRESRTATASSDKKSLLCLSHPCVGFLVLNCSSNVSKGGVHNASMENWLGTWICLFLGVVAVDESSWNTTQLPWSICINYYHEVKQKKIFYILCLPGQMRFRPVYHTMYSSLKQWSVWDCREPKLVSWLFWKSDAPTSCALILVRILATASCSTVELPVKGMKGVLGLLTDPALPKQIFMNMLRTLTIYEGQSRVVFFLNVRHCCVMHLMEPCCDTHICI